LTKRRKKKFRGGEGLPLSDLIIGEEGGFLGSAAKYYIQGTFGGLSIHWKEY
jgi:hypothetical protein